MQIKMPHLRSIAAEDPPEADEPDNNQSGRPSRASRPSHSGNRWRPSANEHVRILLRGCDKVPYGTKSSSHRDLVYAPPHAAVQRFIEASGCPAYLPRITPEDSQYFEGWFKNVTLAGKYSNVKRFLHAIPLQLRRAIERVYCFIDGESPSSALRFYRGQWRQHWSGVCPDAWRDAEKQRRRAAQALIELLGDRVQVVQVFTYKSSLVTALKGITRSNIDVPEHPEEPPEASGAQAEHNQTTEQNRTAEQQAGGHGAEQSSRRGGKAVHRMQWESAVDWAATVERGVVHRQVYAGQRRQQYIPYDPEQEAFVFDQEPYQAW